ncbi:MAG: DUF488 domain-containing protein [Acidobacteria bacterium]|nr:DUF488 domain-containing protein [Acidobacteriota bacterium]
MQSLFTIGHSNHSIDAFVKILLAHNIAQVVDVRTFPSSRYSPQFNQQQLSESLAAAGIDYVWAGKDLGGRRKERNTELRQTGSFKAALRDLIRQSQRQNTTLMCAEEDPFQCHRRYLIARALMEDFSFLDIEHIRKDSTLQREPGFPESAVQLTLGIE